MKLLVFGFLLLTSVSLFSQKDSLKIEDRYWEDQLYIQVTYNVLSKQPIGVGGSGFSFGFSGGYIKDIPFNKSGRFSLGIGLGYNYDSFNHKYKISKVNNEVVFDVNETQLSNKLILNNLEFPLEFRFRTSTINDYTFWRLYAGIKFGYNLNNSFSYITDNETRVFENVSRYNKWQTGLTLSAGYGAFNFYVYYGLTSLFSNAKSGIIDIPTKITKFGLVFYLL